MLIYDGGDQLGSFVCIYKISFLGHGKKTQTLVLGKYVFLKPFFSSVCVPSILFLTKMKITSIVEISAGKHFSHK